MMGIGKIQPEGWRDELEFGENTKRKRYTNLGADMRGLGETVAWRITYD